MTPADYAILAIILVSAVLGLVRGFLREVASLLIWMLGFWLAMRFGLAVSAALTFVKDSTDRLLAGYGVILVGVLIVSTVVGMLLKKLVESSGSSTGDRSLGTLFGAARGVMVVTVLIVAGGMALAPPPPWWRNSKLIPYAAPLLNVARRMVPAPDFHPLQQPATATADLDPS